MLIFTKKFRSFGAGRSVNDEGLESKEEKKFMNFKLDRLYVEVKQKIWFDFE